MAEPGGEPWFVSQIQRLQSRALARAEQRDELGIGTRIDLHSHTVARDVANGSWSLKIGQY